MQFPHSFAYSLTGLAKTALMACLLGEATDQAKPFADTPVDQFKHFDDSAPAAYGTGKIHVIRKNGAQIP